MGDNHFSGPVNVSRAHKDCLHVADRLRSLLELSMIATDVV
jgi:hypothetical protein